MGRLGAKEWELHVLAGWQLFHNGLVVGMAHRQQRVIAAIAVLGPTSRWVLAGLLWPESSESQASGSLRAALHIIARDCPRLLSTQHTMLALEPEVAVDYDRFLSNLSLMTDADGPSPSQSIDSVTPAALLPGWYEDWVLFERERLLQRQQQTLAAWATQCLQYGDISRALKAANAAAAIEPFCETSESLVIACLLRSGNRALAVRSYDRFSDLLWAEMGIQPSAKLRGLISESGEM